MKQTINPKCWHKYDGIRGGKKYYIDFNFVWNHLIETALKSGSGKLMRLIENKPEFDRIAILYRLY